MRFAKQSSGHTFIGFSVLVIVSMMQTTSGAFAQDSELQNVTLAEPVVVMPPVDGNANGDNNANAVGQEAASKFVILAPDTLQAKQVIHRLPPAPPAKFDRNPSVLPARGGTSVLRSITSALPPLTQPLTQPFSPSISPIEPMPLPYSGKQRAIWSAAETFEGVKPWVAATGRRVGNAFSVNTIYGVAQRGNVSEHPLGLALDFMVYADRAKGDAIAAYLMRHAGAERISYIIWQQRIWHAGDPIGVWQMMKDRGDATANHLDHVHASFAS